MPWQPPSLTVTWGAYRKPDPEEQKQTVDGVAVMLGANKGVRIITREIALEKLRDAGVIDFESTEKVIEDLDTEQDEADEKARVVAENQLVDTAAVEVDTEKRRARIPQPKPKGTASA